jgi:hypothetical protein
MHRAMLFGWFSASAPRVEKSERDAASKKNHPGLVLPFVASRRPGASPCIGRPVELGGALQFLCRRLQLGGQVPELFFRK